MRLAYLVLLVACDAGLPPPEEPTVRTLEPIADGSGGWYAVLEAVDVQHECTGLGGMHIALRVIDAHEPVPAFVHAGGHGKYLGVRCGARFVARIASREPWTPAHGCIDDMPAFDGALVAIRRLEHGTDAHAELSRAARDGLTGELEMTSVSTPALDAIASCRPAGTSTTRSRSRAP